MLSPDQRLLKPGLAFQVTAILPAKLRTWRRKGYLADIGFPPGHGHALYSFLDFVTFALVHQIERHGIKAPQSVNLAIAMRPGVREMLESSTDRHQWSHWGWTSKLGGEPVAAVFASKNPMEWIEIQSIFGSSTIFSLFNVARIAREVAARLDGIKS